MTILEVVYASAPTDEIIIPSLEIQVAGHEPIRICSGFEDQMLGIDGELFLSSAGSLQISLPDRNASGQQTLMFGFSGANGIAQNYVGDALEANQDVPVIYREYLYSDKSAPASRPLKMVLKGGQFVEEEAQFEAGYYDLLNAAWPRERFTAENAPGIKYL